MRIAFVTLEYPPFILGGSGLYAASLTRELAKKGHEVVVFAPYLASLGERSVNKDTVTFVPVPINERVPFLALQYWLGLPRTFAREEVHARFDLLHFNSFCYWFLPGKLSPAPHVTTVHHLPSDAAAACAESLITRVRHIGSETSPVYSFIEKRGISFSDKLIADSAHTRSRIIERYAIRPEKIETIYCAIDFHQSNFSEEELAGTRKALDLPDLPVALFVGRVDDPRKGLDWLLHAFKDVVANQEACLLIVGSGRQVESRRRAAALGISDRVVFAGKVDERTLLKCYALCSVYVCASRLEGFGLTLLEAMAAAKPIVATNVGAIPELMTERNGSLVDPGDISALANAICQYLENQGLSESVGAYNAMYVRRRFDWQTTALGTEKVYKIVTSQQ